MFYVFCKIWGMYDTYMQNRYWDKFYKEKGYVLMVNDKGEEFWVGYGE